MTEGQRVKLEQYLDEFEVAVTVRTLCDHPNALEVAVKATDDHRERILDHLDTIQRSETIFTLIYNWLQEEREEDNGTCYEEQVVGLIGEERFEMGVLAGRVECAEGLIAQIDKWEQRISNQEEND